MMNAIRDIFEGFFISRGKRRWKILYFFRKRLSIIDYVKNSVDGGIYFVSVASPMTTIPQIWSIYVTQDTTGLSLITWTAYLFLTFFWLAYGYLHQDRPIIITQVLWAMVYAFVTIQIIIYGGL